MMDAAQTQDSGTYRLSIGGVVSLRDPAGRDVPLKSARARALLAYLALPPGKPRSREEIMALLWSERGEAQARASLRQVLTGLRKSLGEDGSALLRTDRETLTLDPERLHIAEPDGEDFLTGLRISDPAFDDWLRDERQRRLARADEAIDKPALAPPLPGRPSIAVLPLADLSLGQDEANFADGMTQDIVAALSKIPRLFVTAKRSTESYRNREVDAVRVGREQGVRYLLDGSIRRQKDRLRISARLSEAATGQVIWAERYDRVVEDLFELQDEITRQVVSALQIELTEGEQARLWASGTHNHEAWECVIQISDLLSGHRREDVLKARTLAERALELDADYASAWIWLGWSHVEEVFNGWVSDTDAALNRALEAADRARQIDPSNPEAFTLLGFTELNRRQYDSAYRHVEEAMSIGPNNAFAFGVAANIGQYCDDPDYAIPLLGKAMRLCPIYPAWYAETLGWAYLLMRRHDRAVALAREAVGIDPDYLYSYIVLAVAHAETGREDDARAAAAQIRRIVPEFSCALFARTQPFRDADVMERHLTALRRAGVPD